LILLFFDPNVYSYFFEEIIFDFDKFKNQ
jgi:hypothetical protein